MNSCKIFSTIFVLAVCVCIIFTQAARATFLQGYLEQSDVVKPAVRPTNKSERSLNMINQTKTTQFGALPLSIVPQYAVFPPSANSYPRTYEGCWQCMTMVTYSSIKTIEVGTKIACDVTFFRTDDDRTWAHFNQAGWAETKVAVLSSSKIEAQVERTDNFECAGHRETWIAHSQDHFRLVSRTAIVVDSSIEQIHNGSLVGNYRTRSILCKRTGP